jgi:hypothetical protein
LVIGCLWVCGFCAATRAQGPAAEPPTIESLQVGFGGLYKVGRWTSVTVTCKGGSSNVIGTLRIVTLDSDGVPARVTTDPARPFGLNARGTPGETITQTLYARFGQDDADLVVELVVNNKVAARRTFSAFSDTEQNALFTAISNDKRLFVLVGTPVGLEDVILLDAGERMQGDQPAATYVARVENAQNLPSDWYAYDGVEAVVLSGSRAADFTSLDSDNVRFQALELWVRHGGRLLVLCGSAGADLLSRPDAEGNRVAPRVFDRFVPGTYQGMIEIQPGKSYEAYCGTVEALLSGDANVLIPRVGSPKGLVEADAEGVPIVIRAPVGLGEVVFAAGDFDQAPFIDWKGRAKFLRAALGHTAVNLPPGSSDVAVRTDEADLVEHVRLALDRFAAVKPVPFWVVALLICGYIALIGPGDYFFLRHVVKRMELTWITFPTMVIVVSVGAYALTSWLKGNQLQINQIDVVDVETETGLIHGTSWINVFSPRMDYYNLAYSPRFPTAVKAPRTLLAGFTPPEGAMGGMRTAGQPASWGRPYDHSPSHDGLTGLPIQVWSTRRLTAEWTVSPGGSDAAQWIEATLTGPTGYDLSGTVSNRLSADFEDCLVLYSASARQPGGAGQVWCYPLGRLEAGASKTVGPGSGVAPEKLRNRVTEPVLVDEGQGKFRQVILPYDATWSDPERFMPLILFYEAVDGPVYTQRLNRFLQPFDMSGQLALGRGVVMVRTKDPAGRLVRDGQPMPGAHRNWTWYRFVVPIRPPEEQP